MMPKNGNKQRSLLLVGAVAALLGLAPVAALAQPGAAALPAGGAVSAQDWTVRQWLERWHQASRERSYSGTFVVTSGADMAVSKIWHVCDGVQQLGRVETLTGAQRVTLRRNDEVLTFVPEKKLVFKERRESLRLFPDLLHAPQQNIATFYAARVLGTERVAGFDSTVVDFLPRDTLRHAYRIWSEQQTGLVVKMQTRDMHGRVLEQVAFTELQFEVPVRREVMTQQMENIAGFKVVEPVLRTTTPHAHGWRLKSDVPGFQSMSSYIRLDAPRNSAVQWIFSDGLASVSLFLEAYDPQRHSQERTAVDGVTYSVSRRLGDHWVTALGEVPVATLVLFINTLERTR